MAPIDPKNLSAQLDYRGRGNPPSTHPREAIANCFPGLEFDFRNVWRRLFTGIELHEASNRVVRVEPGSEAEARGVTTQHDLVSVAGVPVRATVRGVPNRTTPLEWANALAPVLAGPDRTPECRFEAPGGQTVVVRLALRPLFEGVAIARDLADPGDLTQSLCSPWQADYRECACFYWAASRPDFVNVEVVGGQARGHNWMDRARQQKQYLTDDPRDARLFNYDDLYRGWERVLRFELEGQDEE
jgi:hypothetical protein